MLYYNADKCNIQQLTIVDLPKLINSCHAGQQLSNTKLWPNRTVRD